MSLLLALVGSAPSITEDDRSPTYLLVATLATSLIQVQAFTDRDEIPQLFGTEEHYESVVRITPAAVVQYRQLPTDPDEIPAGTLYGQGDEDLAWPVATPQQAIYSRLYLPDADEIWTTTPVTFAPDDDSIALARPALVTLQRIYLPDGDEIWVTNPVTFAPEDDSIVLTRPIPWAQPRLPIDPDDVMGGLYGQPDEDYWQNQVAPTQVRPYVRLPFTDPDETPAGTLFGAYDEDFDLRLLARQWVTPQPRLTLDTDDGFQQRFVPDEDYWFRSAAQGSWTFMPVWGHSDFATVQVVATDGNRTKTIDISLRTALRVTTNTTRELYRSAYVVMSQPNVHATVVDRRVYVRAPVPAYGARVVAKTVAVAVAGQPAVRVLERKVAVSVLSSSTRVVDLHAAVKTQEVTK